MIVAVIVAVEIAFWVLLAAGVTARYLLRLPRGGATAGVAHGLAAV